MPLPYRSVKDLYDAAYGSDASAPSMPDWASEMKRITNSDVYDEGLHDNFIKRGSVGIDKLLEATGLPTLAGQAGRAIGGVVGAPDTGEEIGKGLPRTALNFLPRGIPYAGPFLTAALAGSEEYTKSGSPAGGLVSGLTNTLMPNVAGAAENFALRKLGGSALSESVSSLLGKTVKLGVGEKLYPRNVGQGLLTELAGQGAAAIFGEAGSFAQEGLEGHPLHNPFSVDTALSMTLGQAPFALFHLATGGFAKYGGEATRRTQAEETVATAKAYTEAEAKWALEKSKEADPVGSIPIWKPTGDINPKLSAEIAYRLDQIGKKKEELKAEGTPMSMDEWNKQDAEERDLISQQRGLTGGVGTLGGRRITADSERFNVVGTEHHTKEPNEVTGYPGFRIIRAADDPANVDLGIKPGELISYSRLHEPEPKEDVLGAGNQVFSVPTNHHTRDVTDHYAEAAAKLKEEQQVKNPELPPQEVPKNLVQFRAQQMKLDDLQKQLDGVTNEEDLQKVLVDYNHARVEAGYPPLDDAKIERLRGSLSVPEAIRGDMDKLTRKIKAKEEAQRQADERVNPLFAPIDAAKRGEQVDEESLSLANDLQRVFINSGLSSDHFNRIAAEWDSNGRPGGVEGLTTKLSQGKRTGKGKVKVKAVEKVEDAAKKPTDGTMPLVDKRNELAGLVAEIASVNEPSLSEDAANWVDWVESGTKELPPTLKGKPHIDDWNEELHDALERAFTQNSISRSLDTTQKPTSGFVGAGKDFVFSLAPYDSSSNTLNGKHRLPNTSLVLEESFRKMAGRDGRPIPAAEMELHKLLVPEAFVGGNVNVKELYRLLPERQPVVEVKKLGEGGFVKTQDERRIGEVMHELDTKLPNWRHLASNEIPEQFQALYNEQFQLSQRIESRAHSEARYSFLGPKPESSMPGYVEGLVRIPYNPGVGGHGEYVESRTGKKKQYALYQGPHFGGEDTNVLAFYRGYEETLPNGEKAFHVIEVQSDWGQRERRGKEAGLHNLDKTGHPLLSVYETLALKSAIQHAQSIGATKVILSDAETAMMTEGHDKAARLGWMVYRDGQPMSREPFMSENEAQTSLLRQARLLGNDSTRFSLGKITEPSQSGGMRLHYDQTLANAMAKLTGDKGERVEVGVHKGATESRTGEITQGRLRDLQTQLIQGDLTQEQYEQQRQQIEAQSGTTTPGSPVFRDTSSNPKTQITGRVYDLSKLPEKLSPQGGKFTLTEASRALQPNGADRDWSPFQPQSPEEKAVVDQLGLPQGGVGLATRLTKSVYPWISTLGKAFLQYPEALKRVTAELWNTPHSSFAFKHGDISKGDNRIGIILDSALLHADPELMEWTIAHELLHGLTKGEMDNPTKAQFTEQITQLREKLIDRLSTKGGDASERAAFDRAVASDWMQRWNEGTADPEELHANPHVRHVLYGLLNNDELVTQGFTSDSMRRWLQGQKWEKTQTAWHKFAGWVKELLGLGENAIDHSAFDALMNHTSELLQHGEYISSARNYFDRFFSNKGLGKQSTFQQTQRALGLVLSGKQSMEGIFDKLIGEPSPSGKLSAATQKVDAMFASGSDEALHANSILGELGLKQDRFGLDALAMSGASGEHSDLHSILELLPTDASRYLFEKWNDAKNVLDAVKGAVSKENEGTLNLAHPASFRPSVDEAHKALSSLARVKQEHDEAEVAIKGMSTINPPGLLSKALTMGGSKALDDIKLMVDPDTDKKGFLTGIERLLSLPAQIARTDPRGAEIVDKMTQRDANIRRMKSESLKIMATDQIADTLEQARNLGVKVDPRQIGDLSKDSLKRTLEVFQKPKLTKAVNAWIFENQKRNPGAEVLLPHDDAEVAKLLGGLSDAEKTQVNETMHKIMVSKQVQDAQVVEKMQLVSSTAAAKVIGRIGREFGLTLSPNQRIALSSQLLEAQLVDFNDPQQAMNAQAKVAQVGQALPPEAFNELLKFTQVEAEKIKLIRDNMAQRPGWVSGQDYGRFRIVYFDKDGKIHRWSGNDESEARAVAKAASKVESFRDRKDIETNDQIHYPSLTPELIERIRQLEETSWDIQGLSPEERERARQSFSVATQIEREAGAQGVPGVVSPSRRLSRGAEDLPWAENHFSWVTSSSSTWSNRLLRSQFDAHMAEPEVQESAQYKKWATDYYEGFMRKDPELAVKMRKFTSIWFLGANLASAMTAHPIGNGMRILSELTRTTGKPIDSYSRYIKAAGEIAGNIQGRKEWATPEHTQFFKDAVTEGRLHPTLYDENEAAQEAVSTQFKQMIEGQKPQTLGKKLGTMAGVFSQVAMWPFRTAWIWNEKVALLSSFDLYREQGLSYQDAKAKAFEFNGSVNDQGGRANRPVGPFSARGELPRSAALLATSMQNYVLGSTFQLVRYLKDGLFRPNGLTPHEIWSARKAAIQMLSMQFAAAGILGMPFVSGGLALLDKAFPELELNRKLREHVKEFFDSDEKQGNVLSDIAMTGVPSMFGWDMQSRLSMGHTLPGVSEVNGFQPEQLLGPPASIVSQFVRGGQRLVAGQGSITDWTPPSVKKILQLVSSGGSSVNDYKGRPVLDDLTPGEKLGIGLGFNPKRLSDFNAAEHMADAQQRVSAMEENRYRQGLAEQVLAGNFGSVRQSLLNKSQQDSSYDPVQAVKAVAKSAEELTFPRDLRREGSVSQSPERARLLSAFQLQDSSPNEMARLQFRTQVEQRLGLQSQTKQGEVRLAQLMDQMRVEHPNATRAELRRAAELALKRTQRPALQLQE